MRHQLLSACVAVLVITVVVSQAPAATGAIDPPGADQAALETAFTALGTYDWGTDRELLKPIDNAVVAAHGDALACKQLEDRLNAVLKSGASRPAKDYACRKLMLVGTAESAPVLGGLLQDKEMSHMARFALERIPAAEAAGALRNALPQLTGELKAGVIASLGTRRDVESVPLLAPC